MKAKQENIVKEREKKLAQKQAEKERERLRLIEAKEAEKNRQKKQVRQFALSIPFQNKLIQKYQLMLQIQALSFTLEEDEEEEADDDDSGDSENSFKRTAEEISAKNLKKIKKDPMADTSFLPDREREEEENRLRYQD